MPKERIAGGRRQKVSTDTSKDTGEYKWGYTQYPQYHTNNRFSFVSTLVNTDLIIVKASVDFGLKKYISQIGFVYSFIHSKSIDLK